MVCINFACVYAMKDRCAINGWLDTGENKECPYYTIKCIRADRCHYCSRQGDKCEKERLKIE